MPTTASFTQRKDLPPCDTKPMTLDRIRGFHPLGVARILVELFSRVDDSREPPSPSKTKHLRLVTIGISHFCEKARWGLDLLEQYPNSPYYYTEDAHPPVFHAYQTLPLTDGTTSLTPLLVFPSGRTIAQSDKILQEMCPSLYPSEIEQQVKEFEVDLAERLGATIRAICYYYFLDEDKKYYKEYCRFTCHSSSKVESTLFEKMLDKGIDKGLKSTLKWNAEVNRKSVEEVKLVLHEISERLQRNGGEYIFDTRETKYGFTAADLTFAALASIMICPAQASIRSIREEASPAEFMQLVHDFNKTLAGQHCHKIYKLHRPVSKDGKVHIKSGNRDRNPFRDNAMYLVGALSAGIVVAVAMVVRGKKN